MTERTLDPPQHVVMDIPFEIKRCRRKDFRKLRKIAERELIAEHPRIKDWFKEHLDEFESGSRPIWVVKDEGEIIAFLIGRVSKDLDAKCSILFVYDDYRNQFDEIASRLLDKLEQKVSSEEKANVHYNTHQNDYFMRNFFERHGYIVRNKEFLDEREIPGMLWVSLRKQIKPEPPVTFLIRM